MTTDQHDEPSFHSDPWSVGGLAGDRHDDRDDFWGDQADWTTPERTEPDATTRAMRRPSGLLGAVGAWADRALSGGVEPTRSHRIVRNTAADTGDGAPDPTPIGDVPHVDGWSDQASSGDQTARGMHAEVHSRAVGDGAIRDDEHGNGEYGAHEPWDEGWDVVPVEPTRTGVDPLLARLGGLAVVLTLLVPFLLGMRSSGDDTPIDAVGADIDPSEQITTVAAADLPVALNESSPVSDDEEAGAAPVTSSAPATDPAAESESTDAEPVARASALGADTESSDATAPPITAPAQADDPADRLQPTCGTEYEVVAGDFWLRLAEAADVDLDDLLAVNGASTDTALFPGREICLPEGARTPAPPTTAATSPDPVTTEPTTAAPTTAAPTTPPSTAAPTTAPPSPVAPGDVEQIIRDVWPDDLEERALEIAWRESNYIPTAKNFCCYGVFQIYWEVHRGWLADLGVTSAEQLYDPTTNARAALTLYQRAGGWGPWGF